MIRAVPRRVWLFAISVAVVLSVPYVVGQLSAPPDWQFSGAAAVPSGFRVDFNSHLAKMWQGWRGQWDYQLLFTHEAHPALPTVQAFYIALGALARFLPLDFAVIYHLARFSLSIGMILALWVFSAHFFAEMDARWYALCFGALVGGWSWVLLLVAPQITQQPEGFPIEFWLFDAFNLLGAFYMPHFAAAIILQIVAFLSLEKYISGENRYLALMSLALLIDAIIQPYVVLLTFGVVGCLGAYHLLVSRRLSWRRALWLIVPLGVHGGIALFQYLLIAGDPIWAQFTAQNVTASPPAIYYLLGYAPLLLPALLGLRLLWKQPSARWLMIVVWLGLVIILVYAPLPTQRRYLLGVQTPLAMLATYGWVRVVLPALSRHRRPLANLVFFAFAGLSHLFVILSNINTLAEPYKHADLFYHPDELKGYAWLREQTPVSAIILTTFDWSGAGSGGKVVAQTGRRVFLGHWIETVDFNNKLAQIATFYDSSTSNAWRETFLQAIGVNYIWYDESAKALGDWHPSQMEQLQSVFSTPKVTIYAYAIR